ncbi:hypothetical protein BSK59_12900 [Paenibacillus odorifer]|uniref:hypothetical protein n=1 Tax=Paenibacillus odorifer TaxID=189426 RepID=UPI00096ED40C|nr:hypothetical protein [Paenibacillus odorifer]OME55372.1 hypothetical protein BSK59_12900 [Paenibacillus odorifer]
MSTTTSKLGLVKPEFTDEVEHTILSLANNFQKLDDVAYQYLNSPPVLGFFDANTVKLNVVLKIGGYWGWVNLRSGNAAPVWSSLKSYISGDVVVPERDNGHYYICTQSGTSGITEPIFPVSDNGQVKDTRGGNTWISNHMYSVNNIVFPNIDNGKYYVCIQAGESGNTEPVWQTLDGTTTYDKNAVWRTYKTATWKESGVAALFRPFGKID